MNYQWLFTKNFFLKQFELPVWKPDNLNYNLKTKKVSTLAGLNLIKYELFYLKDLQVEAVRENSWAISCIKNPSEKVQLEAVKRIGYAI